MNGLAVSRCVVVPRLCIRFQSREGNPMPTTSLKIAAAMAIALAWLTVPLQARAELRPGWDGKRHVSYQQQKDLFYNYYDQPGPYNGAAGQLYVASPAGTAVRRAHVVTYQPLMPHEFLVQASAQRAYYTYTAVPAGGEPMSATGTFGLRCQDDMAESTTTR